MDRQPRPRRRGGRRIVAGTVGINGYPPEISGHDGQGQRRRREVRPRSLAANQRFQPIYL
jgi:hypothetical protein